jgi:hypothetical protein
MITMMMIRNVVMVWKRTRDILMNTSMNTSMNMGMNMGINTNTNTTTIITTRRKKKQCQPGKKLPWMLIQTLLHLVDPGILKVPWPPRSNADRDAMDKQNK